MKRLIFYLIFFAIGGMNLLRAQSNRLPYCMDMVFDNPGEASTVTKYTNPIYLKSIGYDAIVPSFHIQCALTYEDFDSNLFSEHSPALTWILDKQKNVRDRLKQADEAGLQIYAFTDMLVLPTTLLEKYKKELIRPQDNVNDAGPIEGRLIPDIDRELTQKIIRIQVKELFETFPELDGLMIRFGETYLFDTPYHSGGNPIRSGGKNGIEGHIKLINILKEEVCEKYGKKLFYRTWDFGFFHSRKDVYLKITDQITPHPNLIFSIKYTNGDFHRLTSFNPTVGIGKHNYIIEYQGQPEYYGKGAHPVYVFGGMLNGFSEYKKLMKTTDLQSVSALKKDARFVGMWTWSRGGGWRGPYITNEFWNDVNTQAALNWSLNTSLSEIEVLNKTLLNLGVKEASIKDLISILHKADEAVLKGQCSTIDVKQAGFNVWWSRDQYFSGKAYLTKFIKYITENKLEKKFLDEKDEAVSLWKQIEKLSKTIQCNDPSLERFIRVSSTYGRFKYDIIRQIMIIYVYGDSPNHSREVENAIQTYDRLWEEWQQLKETEPSCATLYEPNAFQIRMPEGVSGIYKGGAAETIDRYRKK